MATSSFFITRSDPRVIWRNRNYQKLGILSRWGSQTCRNGPWTIIYESEVYYTIFTPTSRRSDTTGDPPHHPFQQASRLAYTQPYCTCTSWVSYHSQSPSHSTSRSTSTFPYSNHRICHRELPGYQWMPIPPPFFLGTLALTMAQKVT